MKEKEKKTIIEGGNFNTKTGETGEWGKEEDSNKERERKSLDKIANTEEKKINKNNRKERLENFKWHCKR